MSQQGWPVSPETSAGIQLSAPPPQPLCYQPTFSVPFPPFCGPWHHTLIIWCGFSFTPLFGSLTSYVEPLCYQQKISFPPFFGVPDILWWFGFIYFDQVLLSLAGSMIQDFFVEKLIWGYRYKKIYFGGKITRKAIEKLMRSLIQDNKFWKGFQNRINQEKLLWDH